MSDPTNPAVHPDYPVALDAYRGASTPVLLALANLGFAQIVLDEEIVDRATGTSPGGIAVDAVLSTRLGPLPVQVLALADRPATMADYERLVASSGRQLRRGVPLLVAHDLGELTGGRGWPCFVRTFAELALRPL